MTSQIQKKVPREILSKVIVHPRKRFFYIESDKWIPIEEHQHANMKLNLDVDKSKLKVVEIHPSMTQCDPRALTKKEVNECFEYSFIFRLMRSDFAIRSLYHIKKISPARFDVYRRRINDCLDYLKDLFQYSYSSFRRVIEDLDSFVFCTGLSGLIEKPEQIVQIYYVILCNQRLNRRDAICKELKDFKKKLKKFYISDMQFDPERQEQAKVSDQKFDEHTFERLIGSSKFLKIFKKLKLEDWLSKLLKDRSQVQERQISISLMILCQTRSISSPEQYESFRSFYKFCKILRDKPRKDLSTKYLDCFFQSVKEGLPETSMNYTNSFIESAPTSSTLCFTQKDGGKLSCVKFLLLFTKKFKLLYDPESGRFNEYDWSFIFPFLHDGESPMFKNIDNLASKMTEKKSSIGDFLLSFSMQQYTHENEWHILLKNIISEKDSKMEPQRHILKRIRKLSLINSLDVHFIDEPGYKSRTVTISHFLRQFCLQPCSHAGLSILQKIPNLKHGLSAGKPLWSFQTSLKEPVQWSFNTDFETSTDYINPHWSRELLIRFFQTFEFPKDYSRKCVSFLNYQLWFKRETVLPLLTIQRMLEDPPDNMTECTSCQYWKSLLLQLINNSTSNCPQYDRKKFSNLVKDRPCLKCQFEQGALMFVDESRFASKVVCNDADPSISLEVSLIKISKKSGQYKLDNFGNPKRHWVERDAKTALSLGLKVDQIKITVRWKFKSERGNLMGEPITKLCLSLNGLYIYWLNGWTNFEPVQPPLKAVELVDGAFTVDGIPEPTVECPICYEPLLTVAKLSCGHCFHYECIKEAHKHTRLCPSCRTSLDGEFDEHVIQTFVHGVSPSGETSVPHIEKIGESSICGDDATGAATRQVSIERSIDIFNNTVRTIADTDFKISVDDTFYSRRMMQFCEELCLLPTVRNLWNETKIEHSMSTIPYIDFPKLKVLCGIVKSSMNQATSDNTGRIDLVGSFVGQSKPDKRLFFINSIASMIQDDALNLVNSKQMVYTPSCVVGTGKQPPFMSKSQLCGFISNQRGGKYLQSQLKIYNYAMNGKWIGELEKFCFAKKFMVHDSVENFIECVTVSVPPELDKFRVGQKSLRFDYKIVYSWFNPIRSDHSNRDYVLGQKYLYQTSVQKDFITIMNYLPLTEYSYCHSQVGRTKTTTQDRRIMWTQSKEDKKFINEVYMEGFGYPSTQLIDLLINCPVGLQSSRWTTPDFDYNTHYIKFNGRTYCNTFYLQAYQIWDRLQSNSQTINLFNKQVNSKKLQPAVKRNGNIVEPETYDYVFRAQHKLRKNIVHDPSNVWSYTSSFMLQSKEKMELMGMPTPEQLEFYQAKCNLITYWNSDLAKSIRLEVPNNPLIMSLDVLGSSGVYIDQDPVVFANMRDTFISKFLSLVSRWLYECPLITSNLLFKGIKSETFSWTQYNEKRSLFAGQLDPKYLLVDKIQLEKEESPPCATYTRFVPIEEHIVSDYEFSLTAEKLKHSAIFCDETYIVTEIMKRSQFYEILGLSTDKIWRRYDFIAKSSLLADIDIPNLPESRFIDDWMKWWFNNWKDLLRPSVKYQFKTAVDSYISNNIHPLQCRQFSGTTVNVPTKLKMLSDEDKIILSCNVDPNQKEEDDRVMVLSTSKLLLEIANVISRICNPKRLINVPLSIFRGGDRYQLKDYQYDIEHLIPSVTVVTNDDAFHIMKDNRLPIRNFCIKSLEVLYCTGYSLEPELETLAMTRVFVLRVEELLKLDWYLQDEWLHPEDCKHIIKRKLAGRLISDWQVLDRSNIWHYLNKCPGRTELLERQRGLYNSVILTRNQLAEVVSIRGEY